MGRRALLIVLTVVAAGCGLNVAGVLPDGTSTNTDSSRDGSTDGNDNGADAMNVDTSGDASTSTPPDATTDANVDAGPQPPVFGEDCPKGTIYEDDFSFDPANRWFPVAATWTWDKPNKTYTVTGFNPHGVTWIGPRPKWKDYSVEASIRVSAVGGNDGNAGPFFRIQDVGASPYPNNAGRMYLAAVVLNGSDDVIFGTENNGWTQNTQTGGVTIPQNQWIAMRVDVAGSAIKIYVGTTKVLDTSNNSYATGSIGFKTYRMNFSVRSVKVTCL